MTNNTDQPRSIRPSWRSEHELGVPVSARLRFGRGTSLSYQAGRSGAVSHIEWRGYFYLELYFLMFEFIAFPEIKRTG